MCKEKLDKIGYDRFQEAFTDDYVAQTSKEDGIEEGLGLAISSWAEWTGEKILRVAIHALEDSNFHTEAEKIQEILDEL
jgi:hypothetical protein